MKLLKTIERMVIESEKAYNNAIDNFADEKTVSLLEKQYLESLKLMEMYERMNVIKHTSKKR
jgi:hypothetical protein